MGYFNHSIIVARKYLTIKFMHVCLFAKTFGWIGTVGCSIGVDQSNYSVPIFPVTSMAFISTRPDGGWFYQKSVLS